jgi:hypothetical protein
MRTPSLTDERTRWQTPTTPTAARTGCSHRLNSPATWPSLADDLPVAPPRRGPAGVPRRPSRPLPLERHPALARRPDRRHPPRTRRNRLRRRRLHVAHIQDRGKDVDRRWQARYRDPDGNERTKTFRRKADAQRWIDENTADMLTGHYVDPPPAGSPSASTRSAGALHSRTAPRRRRSTSGCSGSTSTGLSALAGSRR